MAQISRSTPAPTLGWVTNKNISQMAPNEALVLDNIVPRANTVDLINGFTEHATGLGSGAVETLMAWNGPSSKKLLAAANNNIYNATSAGAASSLASGYTNNRWQWVNFETAGGNFVLAVNGADAPINYNGTAISTSPAITGVTAADLIHVNVFKNRLFFVEKDSLSFWYLPISSIGGVAQEFKLGQWCSRGGYLMAMGTWTRDGGNGMDDLAVFLTSEGEALVYQRSDPGSSSDWSLIGVFEVGEPIGRRCMFSYANDLVVITQQGFIPLSRVLSLGESAASTVALSEQITPTVSAATKAYSGNFGWEAVSYPRDGLAIFNVPLSENAEIEQYVVNTENGAWCRFKGLNATSWAISDQNAYFGTIDGRIMLFDNGNDFDGDFITSEMQTSFMYFDTPQVKRFQMVRPVYSSSGNLSYGYVVNTDFTNRPISNSTSLSASGTPWGSAWGSAWSAEQTLTQKWLSGGSQGRCASFGMQSRTKGVTMSISAVDWIMDTGGLI